MKQKLIDKTLWKFLLVGVVNTLVGCGIMFLLYNLVPWPAGEIKFGVFTVKDIGYWVSSIVNYVVGSVVSFFLNKYFTFQKKEWSWAQAGRFALSVAVCWLIAYGAAKPLVLRLLAGQPENIQGNAAMLVGMCLYTGLNYITQRFFAFKK